MLPFLADPRQFTRGVLAEREQSRLRLLGWAHHRWLRVGLSIVFFFGLLTALFPLINYMGATPMYHGYWGRPALFLPLMAGMAYLIHCLVALLTFHAAWQVVQSEDPGHSAPDIRQLWITRWWAVIRYMWQWQVFAGLLKVGLALGLAQFFNTAYSGTCFERIWYTYPLCYEGPSLAYRLMLNPDAIQIALATLIVVVFALLETGLQAALGIGIAGALSSRRRLAILGSGVARFLLIAVAASVWLSTAWYAWYAPYRSGQYYYYTQVYINANYNDKILARDWRQMLTTAQIAVSPLGDGGTVLITDLMRPTGPDVLVVRRLAGAVDATALYILAIWFALRRAIRRAALQPG